MKKILLAIILCSIIFLNLTGCVNTKKEVTKKDLEDINTKINSYFSNNGVKDYENYVFNYIDEENNIVVVGLLDDSPKEQEKFKQTIINSNLIKFVKSNKFVNEDKNQDQSQLKTFIRTYKILNIAESNNQDYLYLTIRQFQDEEVQTIKVKRNLCPQIQEEKNYEFTIKPNKKIEDNILSIFNNSTIISIKETDKTGLNQIQDSI